MGIDVERARGDVRIGIERARRDVRIDVERARRDMHRKHVRSHNFSTYADFCRFPQTRAYGAQTVLQRQS